jgi:DNA replication protein DnaC
VVSAGHVEVLCRCDFLDDTENVEFVGGSGTGKRRLATPIGVQAINHHHHRVQVFVYDRSSPGSLS